MTGGGRNRRQQTAYVPRRQARISPPNMAWGLGIDKCVQTFATKWCFRTCAPEEHPPTTSGKVWKLSFACWKWDVRLYFFQVLKLIISLPFKCVICVSYMLLLPSWMTQKNTFKLSGLYPDIALPMRCERWETSGAASSVTAWQLDSSVRKLDIENLKLLVAEDSTWEKISWRFLEKG